MLCLSDPRVEWRCMLGYVQSTSASSLGHLEFGLSGLLSIAPEHAVLTPGYARVMHATKHLQTPYLPGFVARESSGRLADALASGHRLSDTLQSHPAASRGSLRRDEVAMAAAGGYHGPGGFDGPGSHCREHRRDPLARLAGVDACRRTVDHLPPRQQPLGLQPRRPERALAGPGVGPRRP